VSRVVSGQNPAGRCSPGRDVIIAARVILSSAILHAQLDHATIVARDSGGASDGPAVSQLPPRPARADRAYHRQDKQHPEKAMQTFTGIAADHEDGNAADPQADRDTSQQRAAVVSCRWGLWLARTRKARVSAGGYFLVDSFEERCHYRVAVLRIQLIVRRGGGADFLGGQR
jgi:hypothetical protein